MVQKSRDHHLGCNNGINYLSTGAGFLPSTTPLPKTNVSFGRRIWKLKLLDSTNTTKSSPRLLEVYPSQIGRNGPKRKPVFFRSKTIFKGHFVISMRLSLHQNILPRCANFQEIFFGIFATEWKVTDPFWPICFKWVGSKNTNYCSVFEQSGVQWKIRYRVFDQCSFPGVFVPPESLKVGFYSKRPQTFRHSGPNIMTGLTYPQ